MNKQIEIDSVTGDTSIEVSREPNLDRYLTSPPGRTSPTSGQRVDIGLNLLENKKKRIKPEPITDNINISVEPRDRTVQIDYNKAREEITNELRGLENLQGDIDVISQNLFQDDNEIIVDEVNSRESFGEAGINIPDVHVTRMKPNEPEYVEAKPNREYIRERLSPEEIQRQKYDYLFKFQQLEQRGIKVGRQFNMGSDLHEMKFEYERVKRSREVTTSVKFQRKMLLAFCTMLEFLNGRFDPFDVKLDGWSESIHENQNDYDELFEELYDKYKDAAKLAPELRLILMVGGSAFMFHLTTTMFKSSMPGLGDVLKQNPDLMKQFASAAMNTMDNNGVNTKPLGMFPLFQQQASPTAPLPVRSPISLQQPDIRMEEVIPTNMRGFVDKPSRTMNPPSDVDDLLRELQMSDSISLGSVDNVKSVNLGRR